MSGGSLGRVVSDTVRKRAVAAGAGRWIAELSDLIASLEAEWAITVGHALEGGTEAFVAEAVSSDGTPVVIKLLVPGDPDAARREITVLGLADGIGCAALLNSDAERGALLLERLGSPMSDLGLPPARRQDLLCDAASLLWRNVPDTGLPSGASKGRWLADFIPAVWERVGRPCSERAIAHALGCAERRIAAHDDERAVVVHGDVHQWNALQAGEGFKLIDPDGLFAEPEYDLGVLMREDPLDGDLRERAHRLASRTQLDVTAIWEWGIVERMSTALLCVELGLEPAAKQMLTVAETLAASQP
jgi:streptomycin 6-kinase